ncbi:hypothetical protein [Saccharopolyspora oryzae]|uniref:Uncharacterized protein n=1 Tax=Saccharopolyspora oryzae TaxID=2997343 RepID=A0ABT4V1S3_9PSEU|nr:hypothetical protein [Saccharopolyspora oryzae]MDA3627904.1 hypothetical protein [Saccharopolyspora oryzae]
MVEKDTSTGDEIKFSESEFNKIKGWLEQLQKELADEPNLQKLALNSDQLLLPGSSPAATDLKGQAATFAKSVTTAVQGMTSTTLPKLRHGLDEAIRQFNNNEDENTYTIQQFMADLGMGAKA